jgi:hypothetical protein
VSARTCPDWPDLLERAPELHFKHLSLSEARLPSEAVVHLPDVPLHALTVCADLVHHVFNPNHTDPRVAAALRCTYWHDLDDWPGAVRRKTLGRSTGHPGP